MITTKPVATTLIIFNITFSFVVKQESRKLQYSTQYHSQKMYLMQTSSAQLIRAVNLNLFIRDNII